MLNVCGQVLTVNVPCVILHTECIISIIILNLLLLLLQMLVLLLRLSSLMKVPICSNFGSLRCCVVFCFHSAYSDALLAVVATSGFLAAVECAKFIFGRGSAPDPLKELTALPRPPSCMECRRGLAMRFLSVRPSVCPSVCQTRAL